MKKIFAYFKHPTESIGKEDSASIWSLIWFYILMQGVSLLIITPFSIAGIAPEGTLLDDIKSLGIPFLVLAFLPPILEELTFRLSLRRNRLNFMISFAVLTWVISSKIISTTIYSTQYLWIRIAISLVIGLILGYLLTQPLQKVRFGVLFYVFAFLFGFLHIFNYAGQITSFAIALYVLIYLLNKVAAGMFFGYIRVRYTIFASITVHFLNNFFPLAAAYYILG